MFFAIRFLDLSEQLRGVVIHPSNFDRPNIQVLKPEIFPDAANIKRPRPKGFETLYPPQITGRHLATPKAARTTEADPAMVECETRRQPSRTYRRI